MHFTIWFLYLSFVLTAAKWQKKKSWLHSIQWANPDAEEKDYESVSQWVSVTGAGIPLCCVIQCVCMSEWNSSQGKCLLQEHWVILHQGHTRNKIPFVWGWENKNKTDCVYVAPSFLHTQQGSGRGSGLLALHTAVTFYSIRPHPWIF